MANAFVHVELNTTDVDKAKKFYGQLFNWELEDVQMGSGGPPGLVASKGVYTMIKPGKGTGGGMLKQGVPGAPSSWLAYVEVEDVAASTQKAKSLGAKVMLDTTEVPGAGWMSVIVDPTGAALGLWKPKPRAA
jgi:predicted enzyme related to lactoylglutathione lyase